MITYFSCQVEVYCIVFFSSLPWFLCQKHQTQFRKMCLSLHTMLSFVHGGFFYVIPIAFVWKNRYPQHVWLGKRTWRLLFRQCLIQKGLTYLMLLFLIRFLFTSFYSS
jgi:hypothetical protein